MGIFDEVYPNVTLKERTSESIETYFRGLNSNADQAHDPTRLREAITGLKFPVNIRNPTARIKTYSADVFERLDAVGFDDSNT